MPPNGHALLSASSSDRWLHCPPSARLCETYADKGSDYAAEGTDAHALCEYKLRKALGMEAEDPTENLSWFDQEMDDCAADYAAYILECVETARKTCADPVVLIEQRVDFSRWVEQGFGTSDAIIIADGTMHVMYPNAEINPLGDWTGGTDVDTGAVNRKLGSDMGDSVTGGGLHGKDLSKADVSVNIYAFLKAQITQEPVEISCAIGDEVVDGLPYGVIVEIAHRYIDHLGGFEKFAEWGLIR